MKMMKLVVLLLIVASAIADPIPRHDPLIPSARVIGGVDITIENAPHQISLQVFGIHICAGSIISARWILSAAHCMVYFPSWYSIRSGSTFTQSGGTVSAVGSVITHDNYDNNGYTVPINDIALLHLRASLIFSSTQAPIGLYAAGQEFVVGTSAVLTGWNILTGSGSDSIFLQSVTVSMVSKAECNTAYRNIVGELFPGQICASAIEYGRGACNGDTGTPLAIDGVLVGLFSWSNGCARPEYPGVYTEIATYRNWINEICGV